MFWKFGHFDTWFNQSRSFQFVNLVHVENDQIFTQFDQIGSKLE